MKSKKPEQKKPSELRKRAEEKVKSQVTPPGGMSDEETRKLIHELRVYQIELEMQNDELRKAQTELEESKNMYCDFYDFAAVGFFTFDEHGLIREANLTAAREFGVERGLLIRKPFRIYIVTAARSIFDQHLQKVFKSDDRQTCEIKLKRKDGSEFYAQLESISATDLKGNVLCRTSVIDITGRKQMEDALQKSEAQLSDAVKIAKLGYWEYDAKDDLFTFNDQFYSIFRTSADKVGGYTMSPARYGELFLPPDDRPILAFEMKKAIETADPHFNRKLEHRIIYADGEPGYISVHYFVVKDDKGRTIKTYGANQDITEHKRSEEKLKNQMDDSEKVNKLFVGREQKMIALKREINSLLDKLGQPKKYHSPDTIKVKKEFEKEKLSFITDEWRATFDAIRDAVSVIDGEGKVIRCNKAMSDFLGKPFPEIIGQKCRELMIGMPTAIAGCPIDRMKETRQRETLTMQIDDRCFEISADPIFDDSGNLLGAVCIISDITERKKSEEQYRLSMEATMDGLWDWDITNNRVSYSPMWLKILGLQHIEPKFEEWESRIHPEDRSACLQSLQRHLNGKTGFWRSEHRVRSGTGEFIWVVGRGSVIERDSNGHALRMIGTMTDISVRKQAEAEVIRLKEFYTSVLENVRTGVWVSDKDDVIIYANNGMELIECVVRDKIEGVHVLTGFPEDAFKNFLPFYLRAKSTLKLVRYYSIPAVTLAGHQAFHSGWLIPQITDGKYCGMICTVEDVTDQKLAEQELQISEEKYGRLIGNLQQHFFYRHDTNRYFTYLSPSLTNILGYTQDEFQTHYAEYLTDNPVNTEAREHTDLMSRGHIQPPYEVEIYHKDRKIRWLELTEVPIFDKDGQVIAVEGVAQDITKRKEAEKDLKKYYEEVLAKQESMLNLSEDLCEEVKIRKAVEEKLRESEKQVRKKLDSVLHPKGDIGELEIKDIIDLQQIQALMDDFYKITNIGIGILDLRGNVLVSTGWQDVCTEFHRIHPEAGKHCSESDSYMSGGVKPGEFRIYKCKNNMWDIVTPIMISDRHLGNLFLGQFFFENEPIDYEVFRAQAEKYGFDEQEYLKALEQVPRWSQKTVDTVMKFYIDFANLFSLLSYSNIKLARLLEEQKNAEMIQRNHAIFLRTLVETIPFPLFYKDCAGRYTGCNSEFEQFTGKPKDQLIGKTVFEVFDREPKEIPRKHYEMDRKLFEHPGVQHYEAKMMNASGELRNVIFDKATIMGEDGSVEGVVGIITDITEKVMADGRIDKYHERLGELASQLALAAENERRRFADELHDVTGQNLALAKIKLAEIRDLAGTEDMEKQRDRLDYVLQLIDEASASTRSLTFELSPPILYELGFEATAEWLGERILKKYNIAFSFEDDRQPKPLADDMKVLLYLSLRELIVNIAKHSKARNATLSIRREGDTISVSVSDDGVGFDASDMDHQIMKSASFGLFSTRERLERLGGELEIVSQPGQGTTATMIAPLKA